MSAVHETLKVNDELSVKVDVIYENGEKYVNVSNVPTRDYESVVTYIYMDALSDHINQEPYLLSVDTPNISLWDIWMENEYKKYSTQPYYAYEGHENRIRLYSDLYRYDGMGRRLEPAFSDNILFPLIINGPFTHFDVFLFLLYLKYPQYKTDIMRFLKYQPVCTKTSDELFIYNLKQTNKDLLKQLNEANNKLSIMNELSIKLKAHEETLSKQSSEIEELKKQIQDKESILMNSNKEIKTLNETIALKEKRIEELSRVEDENKAISNELSSIKESLENEKLKTSQWKSRYIQLKDIITEHAQRTLKDLGDD